MHNIWVTALLVFLIVMTCMTFLTLVFYGLRALGSRNRPADAPAAGEPTADEQLVAVLAAAAREALQAPVKVHEVHIHHDASAERWSRAGRMDIMVSHRVDPKR